MPHLRGIKVRLGTHSDANSGTGDQIYVGVVGSGGGREFPLDVKGFDDFEEGTDITYVLGTIFDPVPPGAKNPENSKPGGKNDPISFRIDLRDVDYVYLRKQGERSPSGDDAYQMDFAVVELYARPVDSPAKRTFHALDNLWFGNEFGHQAWLTE